MRAKTWTSLALYALGVAGCGLVGLGATSVVVEWSTGSEINTAGFNLYRSDSPEGPFVKVNPNLIPASTDPLARGKYRFEDTTVQAGQTYYYQLEDVEFSGASARHGPIIVTAPAALDSRSALLGAAAAGAVFILGARLMGRRARRAR